jgi:hypothetical protein
MHFHNTSTLNGINFLYYCMCCSMCCICFCFCQCTSKLCIPLCSHIILFQTCDINIHYLLYLYTHVVLCLSFIFLFLHI